jgi:hypothetical protein
MYGINKAVSEELLIIEMYRTLRDRAPYPADVAVKHLEGSFGFVLFDQNSNTVFAATVSFRAGLSKLLRGLSCYGLRQLHSFTQMMLFQMDYRNLTITFSAYRCFFCNRLFLAAFKRFISCRSLRL